MHLGSNLVAPDLKINLSFKARQIVCVNPFLCFLVLVNDNHQLNARNWCDWEMPHGRGEEKKKKRAIGYLWIGIGPFAGLTAFQLALHVNVVMSCA